jgi:predicted CXXCH cytochrome family protein
MRFKYFTLLQIFLFFSIVSQSFAGITQEPEKFTKEQVHGVKQDCTVCHISHNMQGTGILREPVAGLCNV